MLEQPTSPALLHSHTIAMSFANREVPHAVVHSHSCLHSLSLLPVFFRSWGSRSCPQFLIHNSKFLIKELFFLQLEKYFSPTGKMIFCALSNHTTKVRQAQAAIIRFSTIPYDFTCYLATGGFLAVLPGNPR